LNNGIHLMEICDVRKRISPDQKSVSAHAGLERSNLFFLTELPGSNGGSCLEAPLPRTSPP